MVLTLQGGHYIFKKVTILDTFDTTSKQERKDILKWFKETPNGILTSVSILTMDLMNLQLNLHLLLQDH